MVKKDARERIAGSVGTRSVTRRTVTRGIAWTTPVVAVATAAPAFATSHQCTPIVSFGATSCRCTGQSTGTQEFAYFVSFCVNDAAGCESSEGQTFTIVSVDPKGGQPPLTSPPQPNCGYPGLPISGTVGEGGCTATVRLIGEASGINVIVGFTIGDDPTVRYQEIKAPNDCVDGDGRCTSC